MTKELEQIGENSFKWDLSEIRVLFKAMKVLCIVFRIIIHTQFVDTNIDKFWCLVDDF